MGPCIRYTALPVEDTWVDSLFFQIGTAPIPIFLRHSPILFNPFGSKIVIWHRFCPFPAPRIGTFYPA